MNAFDKIGGIAVAHHRATLDAVVLLRSLVSVGSESPSVADCWLLNAAHHLEERPTTSRLRIVLDDDESAQALLGVIVAVEATAGGDYMLIYADGHVVHIDTGYVGATMRVEDAPTLTSGIDMPRLRSVLAFGEILMERAIHANNREAR